MWVWLLFCSEVASLVSEWTSIENGLSQDCMAVPDKCHCQCASHPNETKQIIAAHHCCAKPNGFTAAENQSNQETLSDETRYADCSVRPHPCGSEHPATEESPP